MDNRTVPSDRVELALEDGTHITVRAAIAHRIVGVDADRDAVVNLGGPDSPMHHDDGSEYLVPSLNYRRSQWFALHLHGSTNGDGHPD